MEGGKKERKKDRKRERKLDKINEEGAGERMTVTIKKSE